LGFNQQTSPEHDAARKAFDGLSMGRGVVIVYELLAFYTQNHTKYRLDRFLLKPIFCKIACLSILDFNVSASISGVKVREASNEWIDSLKFVEDTGYGRDRSGDVML
jgi:hypothetical protein